MLINNLRADLKRKCRENNTTQKSIAESLGISSQWLSNVLSHDQTVKGIYIDAMDALGYDVQLQYVPKKNL